MFLFCVLDFIYSLIFNQPYFTMFIRGGLFSDVLRVLLPPCLLSVMVGFFFPMLYNFETFFSLLDVPCGPWKLSSLIMDRTCTTPCIESAES